MRYRLHFWLLASVLSLALFGRASAQEAKTIYAVIDDDDPGKGIYTMQLGDTLGGEKLFMQLNCDKVGTGLLLGNTYYYIDYSQVYNGYKVNGLYSVDMDSKAVKLIADYGGVEQGPIAGCFSYDYQSKTMYGLDFFNGGSNLVTVDLESGVITKTNPLTYDVLNAAAKKNGNEQIHVMTSTYDGDFYGVSYWGALYKINQHTGYCTYIADLDYNPGQAFMYTGDCLFYDNETDQLYMRFTSYDWATSQWLYEMVKIDKANGHVTRFASWPKAMIYNGICVPFIVAEASAPATVQNLKMVNGADGALSTTLEWDNPSKTYGRGGTLEDLDYVLVFRNGELRDSIVNPAIGGHQTWTDGNIAERGYYTYKIVPGNDMGRGDRMTVSSYVGKGDPLGVTDAKAVANGSGAEVSWTAPTEGRFNSYINTASLNYDVIRYKNSETDGKKVAQGLKATRFADTTIDSLAKYTYAIVPHTDNAMGDTVRTATAVFGPAITLPHTFGFNSQDEFDVWTTIDADGNGMTWSWSSGIMGTMKGAAVSYNYDQIPAADWLISPQMKFEAGKRYKVTFDVKTGDKRVPEIIAVSFGNGTTIESQDSIKQFVVNADSIVNLRSNLPALSAAGERNVGLYCRSNVYGFNTTVGNVVVSEDHEGYVAGRVTSDGKPVAGALVIANGGQFTATTDADGAFSLDYLPEGSYSIDVRALGFEDASASATVAQYDTTACDVEMQPLPVYTVSGTVKDVGGDPVAGANVTLGGYDNREATTDAQGRFEFAGVYKNGNYTVKITKNKLLEGNKNFGVEADTDLGTIVLEDNIKPAGKVTVKDNKTTSTVEWKAPANDAVSQRIDDGTLTTSVGIENATDKTMFGVVKREPSTVSGVDFYIDGTSSIKHYSVDVNVFNLDENGNPTDSLLYREAYVPVEDGQWNSHMFPAPVDAPNGYYLALSYSGYLLVGIDGAGDSERWPFVEGVNCFTPDYTTGNYLYLEGQSNSAYHHNFLIRPFAAPYSVPEDATEFKSKRANLTFAGEKREGVALDSKEYSEDAKKAAEKAEPMRTPQSRIRYNVYRSASSDMGDESKWKLLSKEQQARSYEDSEWPSLKQGVYAYAVKAVYTGGKVATAVLSDTVGNKMNATVRFHITTNTPDNESYGAKVTMVNGGGAHVSTGYADENGDVTLNNVWKGDYDITVSLDGFKPYTASEKIDGKDNFEFSCSLDEDRVKPKNLVIDDGKTADEKVFIWNYPDVFFDDFESYPDFEINPSGAIAWQYVDGDETETGMFTGYEWPGMGGKMAFMVFNPKATTPAVYGVLPGLEAYSGDKFLSDWASYGVQNDDWVITPKLHFAKDFKFTFQVANYDGGYPESIEVGYSTTDAQPESFTMVQDSMAVPLYGYYSLLSYDIPKDAKYVAIRCISDQKRVLRIDDIRFGLADALNVPAYLARPASNMQKSPSLDGLYEVYLDGKKVAQQDQNEYTFSGLSNGRHTAGVVASYTSGKTEMSTIEFDVTATGISNVGGNGLKATVEGRTLVIEGDYDSVALYSANGAVQPMQQTAAGRYRLDGVKSGIYIVKIVSGGKANTMKVTLK